MITNRQDFIQYCLRKLGAPVIDINIDPVQIEDRVDEAIEYWKLYHFEGIEKIYLKHRVNGSSLKLITNNADKFPIGSIIHGLTSKASAKVISQIDKVSEGNNLIIRFPEGTFLPGETIHEENTKTEATLSSDPDFFKEGELDAKSITLPDYVYGVSRVLPFSGSQTSKSMFDIQYQLRLNDLYDLTSTSIIYYKQVMSHLALLDLELNGKPLFRFNRMSGKIFLDVNWETDIPAGSFVVLEAYRALDPNQFSKIWSEIWFQRYSTALIKMQWASNIKKYSGIQLPGGVTLDGISLYQEAKEEVSILMDELQNKSAPLEFFMG